jgi:hypothetical protein
MQDAAMRRRIAALVMAALLAMSGAALTTTLVAGDAQALTGNTGNMQQIGD